MSNLFLDKARESTHGSRLDRFIRTGEDLFLSGAITSHGGNLSECTAGQIFITKRNVELKHICKQDIASTYLTPTEPEKICDVVASRELVVHREIYQTLADDLDLHSQGVGSASIVHAHMPSAIFLSLSLDKIEPIDSEAKFTFIEPVPVVRTLEDNKVGSKSAAIAIAQTFKEQFEKKIPMIAVLESHGSFALAQSMSEALRLTTALDAAAKMIVMK